MDDDALPALPVGGGDAPLDGADAAGSERGRNEQSLHQKEQSGRDHGELLSRTQHGKPPIPTRMNADLHVLRARSRDGPRRPGADTPPGDAGSHRVAREGDATSVGRRSPEGTDESPRTNPGRSPARFSSDQLSR